MLHSINLIKGLANALIGLVYLEERRFVSKKKLWYYASIIVSSHWSKPKYA